MYVLLIKNDQSIILSSSSFIFYYGTIYSYNTVVIDLKIYILKSSSFFLRKYLLNFLKLKHSKFHYPFIFIQVFNSKDDIRSYYHQNFVKILTNRKKNNFSKLKLNNNLNHLIYIKKILTF